MTNKTIEELREKVFTAIGEASMCWIPTPQGIFDSTRAEKVGKAMVDEILSRAEQEAVEPLAVLADRKGVYIEWEANYEEEWHIGIDGVKVKQEDFKAPTYAAAEAKVRAYLSSLPDKEGPTTDWTKEGR